MGDGERLLMMGNPASGADGWTSPGHSWLMSRLWDVMRYTANGFHVGISCPCCDVESAKWYRRLLKLPPSRLTYSNLFVNYNYPAFCRLLKSRSNMPDYGITVGCHDGAEVQVPSNVVNTDWDFDAAVDEMCKIDHPILVAAGPASAALISDYWRLAENRQICIDVGSAADHCLWGRVTRGYHTAGTATQQKVCQW